MRDFTGSTATLGCVECSEMPKCDAEGYKNQTMLLSCSPAFEFFPVGALACCARPSNAYETVGHSPQRNAIQHSPRFIGVVSANDLD